MSESELALGTAKQIRKGDKIKFVLKTENHSISIENVSKNNINLTVRSGFVNILLYPGDEIRLNLTSKEYYDLYLKLNYINGTNAGLTIKEINESIIKYPIDNKTYTIHNNSNDLEQNVSKTDKKTNYLVLMILVIFVFAILALFFVIWIVFRYVERKKK